MKTILGQMMKVKYSGHVVETQQSWSCKHNQQSCMHFMQSTLYPQTCLRGACFDIFLAKLPSRSPPLKFKASNGLLGG